MDFKLLMLVLVPTLIISVLLYLLERASTEARKFRQAYKSALKALQRESLERDLNVEQTVYKDPNQFDSEPE